MFCCVVFVAIKLQSYYIVLASFCQFCYNCCRLNCAVKERDLVSGNFEETCDFPDENCMAIALEVCTKYQVLCFLGSFLASLHTFLSFF